MAPVGAARGLSYREISADLRASVGRRRPRGRHPAKRVPEGPQLVIDYLDAFGPLVAAATAPTAWPLIIAIDSKPLYAADHSQGRPIPPGGGKRPSHPQPFAPQIAGRPKVAHLAS